MNVSVVINTYNRAATLRNTLAGLRFQTYRDFEVLVVNGPSTDGTAELLADHADAVRVYRCPEVHLSKSRNIGIAHAAGEMVAFIDDDSVPDPNWIADLVAGYDRPDVGGAGGLVYDHTGAKLQYRYSVCSRVATTNFNIERPFDAYTSPGADPFLYLQGTNCSFRRDVLTAIGGFNEEIEYYLDETEVCLLAIDAGYRLAALDRAAVYHKYAASHIRTPERVVLDPYSTVKNHCTFAVRYGTQTRPVTDVLADVSRYLEGVKAHGRELLARGKMTADQLTFFLDRTEAAAEFGIRQGMTRPRPFRRLPAARPHEFRPYPTHRPAGGRLRACFVSREYPPEAGGVGRLTADLAAGYARLGHEVRVITHGPGHTVDFEDGVWVHRLPDPSYNGEALNGHPVAHNLAHATAVYKELDRVHAQNGIDVVSAPVWLCEGAVSNLDGRWPTLLYLVTTLTTIAQMGGVPDSPHVREMVAMEREVVRGARYIYANSQAVLDKAAADAGGLTGTPFVVHHASRDVAHLHPPVGRADGRVRMLFVGRIEVRKGVDVLLDAAYRVLDRYPQAELHLIGRHNPADGGGETVFDRHRRVTAGRPDLAARVRFHGPVSDDQLMAAYADCDLLVLPSRYESFGLVLTEAMMFGKPVVGVRAGGPAEIVVDGETGFLVPPDDPAELAAALGRLVESADLRAAFGAAGRERYERLFTTDIMVAETVACHRAAVRAHSGGAADPAGLPARLAELVRGVCGVSDEAARQAADELLRRPAEGPDYPAELAALWHLPEDAFVRGVYELLLGRPVDAPALLHLTTHLKLGAARLDCVRAVVESEEGKARRLPAGWLHQFAPPPPPPVAQPAAPVGLRNRAKHRAKAAVRRLAAVPVLGKFVRAGLHLALTPRRVRRVEEQLAALHALIGGQAADLKRCVQAEVAAMRDDQRAADERHRRLAWAAVATARRMDQLVADARGPAERAA